MITQLKCLVVEDDPIDFQLLEHHLRQAAPGGRCRRVDCQAGLRAALAEGGWDIILSDYTVPGLDLRDTLAFLQTHFPELPLILVSGTIGEEQAVEMLKLGVTDFVLKNNLRRLLPAIRRSLHDVAARRERLAAEERYHLLFDNMLNGCAHGRVIFEQDQPRDFIYLAVNQAFEHLTGRKGVVGWRLTEVVPDLLAGNPAFFEPYGRVVRTGIPEKYESYVVALQQWFAVALYRTAPDHFMAVFDVITERKQAEQSLRRSQAVYHSLVTQLPVGIYQKDREGRYVVVNPTLCQLRGMTAATFLGKSALEVARAENEKAGPGALALSAALAREDHHHQILQTGQPIEMEEEFVLADGRREFMHVMKLPVLDVDGQVIGTQGVLFNVTARKQAEAALQQSEEFKQAILDSVTSHIAVLDQDGVILVVNARWHEFARANPQPEGVLPRHSGPGANYLEICRQSRSSEALAACEGIMTVMAGHQESFTLEYRCDAPREKRWFSMVVTRLGAGPQVVVAHTNITERNRAEELLRESEQQFRAMFETAAVGMAQADPRTGQLQRVNRKLCAITGYPEAELLRLRVPEITHPADREADWQLFQAVIRGEQPEYRMEKRYVRKDGSLAWVNINMTVIRDEGGQPLRTLAVIEDITARRLTEEKVAREQARFKLIFDSVPIGIAYAVVQPDGQYQRISNEAHLKICGLTRTQDQEPGIYQRITHPEDWVRQQELFSQLGPDRVGAYSLEKRYQRTDGRVAWVAFSFKREPQPDGSFAELTTLVDISERKARTEELLWKTAFLEALVHSSADGILVVDNQRRKILQNQKVVDLWGIPPEIAGDPDDRRQFEFARNQVRDPEKFAAQFLHVEAHPDELVQDEIELKNGTILDRQTAPVRGRDGQIYGRVWTFHNITRARQLESQYRQAQKMEAIGTLAGGIAHDFNNILCSMFGYGYLAQQEMPGHPLANEYLAEILKAANRAKDLVQQILTFSRQREQKREDIRLGSIIKEAAKFLRASLPADLQIEIDVDGVAPAVLADPTQIYQVVMNLTTNALHAMEGRPGRLVITLTAFEPDETFQRAHPEIPAKPYTRLTVADTGHGMDARTLERIFEPFFTTKTVGKGTGLGLAVVHGIVQAHEGFITVASQPGEGAQFDLFFPAQPAEVVPPEPATGNIPRGQGQRILLLDDEPALTGPFKGLLERLNYQVTTCNLASEALRRFRANPAQFDLVITDLTMPEISGLEVARQLRVIRADLPVILATGYGYSLSAATLKEAGITQMLEKPLALATLATAVQRALGKP